MKKLLMVVASMLAFSAHAQSDLQIEKRVMGSGAQNIWAAPNISRFENAKVVGNYGVYHAPQYMPGYPTASTIWARVIDVQCSGVRCSGYNWSPEMGRGEYLFFRPLAVAPIPVAERVVPGPERVIIKKIRE